MTQMRLHARFVIVYISRQHGYQGNICQQSLIEKRTKDPFFQARASSPTPFPSFLRVWLHN